MHPAIYIWKKAPFIRILVPFMAGIILQWYRQYDRETWYIVFGTGLVATVAFSCFSLFKKFRYRVLGGISILLPFVALGALLAWSRDVRHLKNGLATQPQANAIFVATLSESPVEKTKSVKANATISSLLLEAKNIATKGKIVIYFKKDSIPVSLEYGTRLLFKKSLQEIQNGGNPGGFDYKRYALFQGITHQVFLAPTEFTVLPGTDKKWLPALLEKIRQAVLTVLRNNIPGDREPGLAEALLIGYKNDLDKTLVQSYTNTGVVHIIAISGLHLGLIYWLLVGLLKPLQKKKYAWWLRPLIIIAGLWLFSLLAGAQPSILRSAVMFTCIVLGENTGRKTSIYNTLALSAFLLLCYNPFWLWDLGFQLSYLAVLSIVVFMQPVYNLLYIKNKLLDLLWKMNAVTLAAQILTVPISIYHFHQFPNLFLFTNFVAVPLSSIILLGEIFLCIVFFIPWLAEQLGRLLSWLISLMNAYIERIEGISFSLWDALQINLVQVIFLFLFIAGIGYWLLERSKTGLIAGMLSILGFFVVRGYSFWQSSAQRKLIVYNVPGHQAIDLIDGRYFLFRGDNVLLSDDLARNFHLKPSRTIQRLIPTDPIGYFRENHSLIRFSGKTIMFADSGTGFHFLSDPIPLDLLVISKNPRLYMSKLRQTLDIKQVVFDGSVPAWKLKYWKRDCDSLGIPYHDVTEKGAFVMNLN